MEYYSELRSKNAQNIKTLMCPLYPHLVQNLNKRKIFALLSLFPYMSAVATSLVTLR